MDELQKNLKTARKRAPNVVTIVRCQGSVFALRWVRGEMNCRLIRKG
jgi:hypothetical protein